jgi:hypothetical protein
MATKGIILGACIATFVTSLIFIITGFFKGLKENIITGAVIGPQQLAAYSIIPLVLSFIIGLFIVLTIKK